MRISDWSSDVCSSDLAFRAVFAKVGVGFTVALALGLALIVLLALAVRQLGPGVDLLILSAAAVILILAVLARLGFVLAFVLAGLVLIDFGLRLGIEQVEIAQQPGGKIGERLLIGKRAFQRVEVATGLF